ncbi:MAG: hypothetical protein Q9227_004972 [Pyrenula ochraceoflavens]
MAEKMDLPSRSATTATDTTTATNATSDDEAVPTGDPSTTTGLLQERLQAWKHMCGYLEGYITAVAKDEKTKCKEQERILKSVSHPLKEGHHFDQALGGVAGWFENIRSNTQGIANLHTETSKNLSGTVLPQLERLHKEIKGKNKEISSGAAKGAKAIDNARNSSQKHIELLGTHTGNFDSKGGHVPSHHDPYIIQRQIHHRLNKQIIEENNHRNDILTVQNDFSQFEAHILQTIQAAFSSFNQIMGGQADRHKAIYGDITATAQNMPLDFEWNGFTKRYDNVLVNSNAPHRSMSNVSFPNQGHRATKPLIEGSLERKSRAMGALKGYSSGYYAVTASGYLHEFKDDDDYRRDPTPEHSLYLPDCVIGAVDGTKFQIKGKSVAGGKFGSKMSITSDYQFKAHTAGDAEKWRDIIASQASKATDETPVSPAGSRNVSGNQEQVTSPGGMEGEQEEGIVARSNTTKSTATEKTTTGQGSHFQTKPAENELEERKYVQQ